MKKSRSLEKKLEFQYGTMVMPAFLLFTVGIILPIFMSIYYSFTSWDGFSKQLDFVGIQNYLKMFSDSSARQAWKFTIVFAILNAAIGDVLALLFAVMLDKIVRFSGIYKAIVFIPCLFSSIVTGFVWTKIYGVVLPDLVSRLHLDVNLALLGSPDTVIQGLTIANVWQWTGLWMMVYLAALQSINDEYYDAAKIDGANAVQQFFRITIPLLMPAISTVTICLSTGALKTYDILVTSTQGGPGRSSTSIVYFIYTTTFDHKEYGYGSAFTVSLSVLLLLIALVEMKYFRKKEVQM